METFAWFILGFVAFVAVAYFLIYKTKVGKSNFENNSFYVFMGVSIVLAILLIVLGATVR